MLADLLEKNIKTEKEPPVLNGALRIGEKEGGTLKMELIQDSEKSLKRPPSTENDCNTQAKRPHINGDATPEEPLDEGLFHKLLCSSEGCKMLNTVVPLIQTLLI